MEKHAVPGKCYIALDNGSSSARAFAFSPDGVAILSVHRTIRASYPGKGLAEYDGVELYRAQYEALRELLSSLPPSCVPVSIGIASQRSTIVMWDRTTGMPLCPVLSWQDGRGAALLEQRPLSNEEVHAITGLYKTPYFSASKIAWCIQNFPDVQAALREDRLLCGPVGTYLLWKLTAGKSFVADPTLAQRMLLLDINTMRWSEKLLSAFDIPERILPQIGPTCGDLGCFEFGGHSIPIRCVAGDQQAAVAGAGAITKGSAALTYGTGAFFLVQCGENPVYAPGLLTTVGAMLEDGKRFYMLAGGINAASSMLDWLRQIGVDFAMDEVDALCLKSLNPVKVLPALGGLGSPYYDFKTGTVMAGFSPLTKKEDLLRGTIEGLAFFVADIAELAEKHSGIPVEGIRTTGGLAQSDFLCRTQASLCGRIVSRTPNCEGTALGVAALLASQDGADPFGEWAMLLPEKQFSPEITPQEAQSKLAAYRRFLAACRELHKSV